MAVPGKPAGDRSQRRSWNLIVITTVDENKDWFNFRQFYFTVLPLHTAENVLASDRPTGVPMEAPCQSLKRESCKQKNEVKFKNTNLSVIKAKTSSSSSSEVKIFHIFSSAPNHLGPRLG